MASSTYTVERRAHVDAPPADVYEHVVDFHRWSAWSPWQGLDPDMDTSYSGADAGVGAVYAWSGNRKVGQGRMEITDVAANERIDIDLQFVKPFRSHNTTTFRLEPDGDGTEVVWTMVAPQTLMTRLFGLVMPMDRMVGRDFERGLDRLRREVESA